MIIIYIGKLCYTYIIKLGKYIQNISVATDERPSFMLALSEDGSKRNKES